MKQKMRACVVFVLGLMLLAACTAPEPPDTTLEEFEALRLEMNAMQSYRFMGTIELNIQHPSFGQVGRRSLNIAGMASHPLEQMVFSYTQQEFGGMGAEVAVQVLGDAMYLDLLSIVQTALSEVAEERGQVLSQTAIERALDGRTSLRLPLEDSFSNIAFRPDITAVDAQSAMTRDGGGFQVESSGVQVRPLFYDMQAFWSLGGAGDGDEIADLITRANFEYASASTSIAQVGGSFHQRVRLYLPGVMHIEAELSFIPHDMPRQTPPARAVDVADLAGILSGLDLAALFAADGNTEVSGDEATEILVRRDLRRIYLRHPTVTEGGLLTLEELPNRRGMPHHVAVPLGAAVTHGAFHVTAEHDAIVLHYFSMDTSDALSVVTEAVTAARSGFAPNAVLRFGEMRTNASETAAMLSVLEETPAGMTRAFLYLADVWEGAAGQEETLRLELVLYLNLFGEQEHAILRELGLLFGVDLNAEVLALQSYSARAES